MKVICVDDERLLMEDTVDMCRELGFVDEAEGFTRPADVLLYFEHKQADLVILDIDMPGLNGLELAAAIREKQPDLPIIFLTGYEKYALEAYSVHPSGYLLKPVKKEKLEAEIAHALGISRQKSRSRIKAHTFGNFDLFVDGKPVAFRQAKCKELMAYLIDRQGATVTRREAFAILWENRPYDRPMQKQFDVIIRSLRSTLTEYGVEEIFEMQSGAMRVNPELISCDVWRLLAGDPEAERAFHGEYMSNYSWAEEKTGNLIFRG